MEVLEGASPLLATAYSTPIAVSGTMAAVVTGFILRKLGPAVVMTIALFWFTVGITLVASRPLHQVYWLQLFLSEVITPLGMDMSFPAATLILSDSISRDKQGIAASLVSTVVNHSISLGLGFAGTAEATLHGGGKTIEEIENGYRAAQYVGVRLAGLGLLVCLVFLLRARRM